MAVAPTLTAYNSQYLSAKNTGLGNVLFQLAGAYGISRKVGKQISYHNLLAFGNKLHSLYGLNHKNTIFRNLTQTVPDVQWENIKDNCNGDYDPNIEHVCATNAYTQIIGYLERYEYFQDVSHEFVELIRPDSASLTYIQTTYPFLFDTSINTVAIHIRLHEYSKIYNKEFYLKAIEYINSRVQNPMYLIFTDDPTADFSELGLPNYKIMTTPYDYLDLWTMSYCKHFICSYSTFCVWACILHTYMNNTDSIIIGCADDPYRRMYNTAAIRPPRSILI